MNLQSTTEYEHESESCLCQPRLLIPQTNNEWSDFWRYQIGVNVIPTDTKNKTTWIKWSEYQNKPVPEGQHEQWKNENAFVKGMAIIPGQIWHNPAKQDLYLWFIDLDNQKAIDEFCASYGVTISLEEPAKHLIVEQHKDDSNRAHIFGYSTHPLRRKSSDNIQGNDIPKFEIKGLGEHGIAFCSPSVHKNGSKYEIIGTLEAEIFDEIQEYMDAICMKFNLGIYNHNLSKDSNKGSYNFQDEFLYEGTRHSGLISRIDSLLSILKGKVLIQDIKQLAFNLNQRICKPPLPDNEFESIWKDAVEFIAKNAYTLGNANTEAGRRNIELLSDPPLCDIRDTNYSEYVIKIAKRTVKCEDSLTRLILYTGLSAYTNEPINLGILAPTSEGKTYATLEVMKFFPKEDIWRIGSMSTKVLVRQKGILVDSNNEPIENRIKELKRQIGECGKQNQEKKETLKQELSCLYENSKVLIDLSGKIIIFLEPPQSELWNLIKPILSHDSAEIEFPFVDRNEREGHHVKNVVVRGFPSCIFCSAKDESNWSVWPEIVSRFFITSPNMVPQKNQASNLLVAQKASLPSFIRQQVIVSDKEIEQAKGCVIYLKQQIKKNNDALKLELQNNGVWVPFGQILGEVLPAEKGTDVRIAKQIFALLNLISLIKSDMRPKLVIKNQSYIVATLEDLREVLTITQNVSGIPAYKMKFFKDIFYPLYKLKVTEDERDGKIENRIAVTTKQLCEFYQEKTGRNPGSDILRKTYLLELLNNGIIDQESSVLHKNQYIYYPLVEPQIELVSTPSKVKQFDQYSHHSPIIMPKNCTSIAENWLILEILGFLEYRSDLQNASTDKYKIQMQDIKFLSKDRIVQTIKEFVSEYERDGQLIRFFSGRKNFNYQSKIFGSIEFLGAI